MPLPSSPAGPSGLDFVNLVASQEGKPYVFGGDQPNVGFDCSGLAFWAAQQLGVSLPRTSEEMWNSPDVQHISAAQLQPGDLIFETFGNEAPPGHVVIFAGNDEIIQAAHTGTLVQRDSFSQGDAAQLGRSLVGYGRIKGLSYAGEPTGFGSKGPPTSGTSPDTSGTQPGGGNIDVTAPLKAAGAFLHDVSVPIAWALEVFEPGQGVRLAATGGALVTGTAGIRAWVAASRAPEGTGLPVAVALLGVTAGLVFIAARPWPQPGGKPIKTGAYLVSVVKGEPPAAGPHPRPPVGAVEAGLVTIAGLWAASKAAQGIAAAVTAGTGIGAAFGKLWSKIKPIAEDVGKAGEVAGEAAA